MSFSNFQILSFVSIVFIYLFGWLLRQVGICLIKMLTMLTKEEDASDTIIIKTGQNKTHIRKVAYGFLIIEGRYMTSDPHEV